MQWERSQGSGMSLSLGLWNGVGGVIAMGQETAFLGGPRGARAITEKGLQVDKDKLA